MAELQVVDWKRKPLRKLKVPDSVFAWLAVFDLLFLVGFIRFLMLAGPPGLVSEAQS